VQLPSLDLQAHVRETLETNVMLEAEEETPEAPGRRGGARSRGHARRREIHRTGTATAPPPEQREEPEVEEIAV